MSTLYNKYRPKKFSELIGPSQRGLSYSIQNSFLKRELPSTILLYGPSGVGKTTIARLLAAVLNCGQAPNARHTKEVEPCGECDACKHSLAGDNFTLVDGSVDTGVDAMRELLSEISFPSLITNHRIVVFDEMHNLSKRSQEALLTTVEDPPPNTTIILCTTNKQKIIQTLATRFVSYGLSSPPWKEIKQRLQYIAEKEDFTEVDIDKIPQVNSVREAINLLEAYNNNDIPTDGVDETNPYRQLAITIAFKKKVPLTDIKQWLTTARSDTLAARGTIVEFLHSCILNALGNSKSRDEIRWWRQCVQRIGDRPPESMPALLTTDILDVLTDAWKKPC